MNYARIDGGKVVEIILPATDEDGADIAIERRFHPDFVATLVPIPAGQEVATGDTWSEADGFEPPPPPPAPTADHVKATRDALLAEATLRIAPLQDAADLDDATAAETALLKLWKQYRVALSRIEQQAGFPGAVVWPTVVS
ncbi:hypothetical protein J2W32_001469 [Variovorax boronicumulans]|uniref:Phage tail protein n=1 Tax=Variovorax boronicumulans TaxID=436515 RepID=A0AAW8CVF3_9BURK|nr:tail fiber assembly protein [Variovorax boronicumulans]MDP9893226.1 hypothetical protein [Variovorax boronicumulans]MDQ0052427.1 hypothetical protein [Variovorax boronicumulans]